MNLRTSPPALLLTRVVKTLRRSLRRRAARAHALESVDRKTVDVSSPVRLILHVGVHKTGSTSIQAALHRNYLKLLAAGILYPSGIFVDRQHSLLHDLIKRGPQDAVADFFWSLRQVANRLRCKTVILSGEQLSLLTRRQLGTLVPLLATCNFDTTVVIFTRPPLALLRSRVSQRMLSVPKGFVTPYTFARATKRYDIEAICAAFTEAFGSDRVIRHDLQGGEDAVALFADYAGVSLPPAPRRNTSTDFAVMSLINALNEDFEFSSVSIHAAYDDAFGSARSRFSSERRFLGELLGHFVPEMRATFASEFAAMDPEQPSWTRAEQIRYLKSLERFIRHLRRDHAWTEKGRFASKERRTGKILDQLGSASGNDNAARS